MAAAEVVFGVPVNLDLSAAYIDLGAEQQDAEHVVVLALDDGNGAAHVELSPEQCELLADVLRGLARIGSRT